MVIVYSKTNFIITQKVVIARKKILVYINNSYCIGGGDDMEPQCKQSFDTSD